MALTDIVFIHQNMPGQFRHLAPALAQDRRLRVFFVTRRTGVQLPNVRTVLYPDPDCGERSTEPFARPMEVAARFGHAVARVCLDLRAQGVRPRLVIVHPGWGEGLLLRDIWPDARILSYAEFYYQPQGADIGFDPLFPVTAQGLATARMMNGPLLLSHAAADLLLAPTHWQKHRHPDFLHDRIEVVFDGIDTARVFPDPGARFTLPDGRVLDGGGEVITYVARNLEPHRGYHVFLRALPRLLAARPRAQVVIVGGVEVSYSPLPRDGHANWREALAAEVDLGADAARVHHVGKLPYADYLSLLRISAVHVYLTFPFVLSWSCLEAMAAGCLLVASDTAPVREVVEDGVNGRLFPFHDGEAMVGTIVAALEDRAAGDRLRAAARATVAERYALRDCLPRQLRLVERLLAG
ncbi:MAG: glycosyltransferase [Sphingomonadales bacterium]|nr:glycosyltransferase [Sphingomonadales bacterium]